jgi:putative photosynthetic complex assembly protein
VLGLGLIGFAIAATAFGMTTGIGVMRNTYGEPQAIRDIASPGRMTRRSRFRRTTGAGDLTLAPDRGRFRARLARALSRMRLVAGTPQDQAYRLIRWENGSVSLSDTATGERIYLNAFGPDNAAAYEATASFERE